MIPLYGGETDPTFVVAVAALWFGAHAYEHLDARLRVEPDPVDDLRDRYVAGDLTLEEFEDRVALELDDRAQETRQRLERIDGIGPETSATIARQYRTLDELRDANHEEIEDVHGIGPSTSKAVKRELQ
jgi:uncharacterized Ntn-hydrolase superfamily protein